jgi:NADP-dependent 3-hydroxy acid dehydrogenase YdfG
VEGILKSVKENASVQPQVPVGCHAYSMGSQQDSPTAYHAICHKGDLMAGSNHSMSSIRDQVKYASVTALQTKAMRIQTSQQAGQRQAKEEQQDMVIASVVWSASQALTWAPKNKSDDVLLVKIGDLQNPMEHNLKAELQNAGARVQTVHIESSDLNKHISNLTRGGHVMCLVAQQALDHAEAKIAEQLVDIAALVKAYYASHKDSPAMTIVFTDGHYSCTSQAQMVSTLSLPSASALWGACRSIRTEYPALRLKCVESDAHMDKSQMARCLVCEIYDQESAAKEVMYQNAIRYISRIVQKPPSSIDLPLNEHKQGLQSGSYVVTGGLGGLGLVTAHLLADMGATCIVLLSRSGLIQRTDQDLNDYLNQLKKKTKVQVVACDVSKQKDVGDLLRTLQNQGQPCMGLVHAAGVLRDGLSANLKSNQVQQVFDPKIGGASYLHQHTLLQPLKLCIMFSSIAALFGNTGQAAYSAANTYLDTLAAHRQMQGLPAVSIQWPAISGVGMWERNKTATPFILPVDEVVSVMQQVVRVIANPVVSIISSDIMKKVRETQALNDKDKSDRVVDRKHPSWFDLPATWQLLQLALTFLLIADHELVHFV